jgi:hypothetical protein
LVRGNLADTFRAGKAELVFATNLSVRNMVQAVTDPRAILSVAEAAAGARVIHLPGLHAKAYVADGDRAIITSGNLTGGGLHRNLELGVLIRGCDAVEPIQKRIRSFLELGAEVPASRLAAFGQAVEKASLEFASRRRGVERRIAREFRSSLSIVEDELLELRLSQGPLSAVFSKTIEYLLKSNGAMTTVQLHPEIAALHPDLCDDSIDRVIGGRRFGKKWKHAVRSAQQRLKQSGIVEYAGGYWRLK